MSSPFSPGIGRTIHRHAKKHNCAVVRDFLGHGIGDFFHGPPDIYHCLNNYPGRGLLHSTNPVNVQGCVFSGVMKPGMVFTIEPCISEGDRRIKTLQDGWTTVTLVV